MAVAVKHLAGRGFSPRGTLIYAAVADEEALGTFGAAWLLKEHPDAVRADYVITESGGFKMPLPSTTGPKLPVIVAEKGAYWCTLRIRGTPGHASMPFRTDNALVKAARVVCALAAIDPTPRLDDVWNRFVSDYDLLLSYVVANFDGLTIAPAIAARATDVFEGSSLRRLR